MKNKRFRFPPFSWLPASWGLRGRPRAEAEAHYYLSGRALAERLLEIRHDDNPPLLAEKLLEIRLGCNEITPYEHDLELLKLRGTDTPQNISALDYKHGKLSHYEHDLRIAELDHPEGKARDVAVLTVNFEHGRIERPVYEKARATILEEPWFRIVNDGLKLDEGVHSGFFEFDWNEYFIDYLRLHGFTGLTDEEVVDHWFGAICRSQIEQSGEHARMTMEGGRYRA